MLQIVFIDNTTQRTHTKYATIKEIYHSNLVEIDYDIGTSFALKIPLTNKFYTRVSKIISIQLIFNKMLNPSMALHNKYIGNNIMMFNDETIGKGKEITKRGCICDARLNN